MIIRKPKFMRDDSVMRTLIDVAAVFSTEACRPEITLEQKVYLLMEAGKCLNRAAKAGGFFSAKDMYKYYIHH